MPVFNGESFLKGTVSSILGQTFPDFEFIIINDGSQDHSEREILSFTDPRIRYLSNEVNRGLIFTLNRGIDAANGEYIARIDADDIADADRLQKQIDFLTTHGDYGMCGTFYRIIDERGRETGKVKLPEGDKDIRTYLLFGNCFCHSSIMVRTSLAQSLNYDKDFELCEDYDLWSRISARHKVGNLPTYSIGYRVHGNNVSVKKRKEMLTCVSKIHARGLKHHGIPFTSEELNLHSALLSFDHIYCSQKGFDLVEEWASKLCRALNSNTELASKLAIKVIIRRWITVCYNAGEYKRLFNNRLLKEYEAFYCRCLGGKIMDKCFSRNNGYDL